MTVSGPKIEPCELWQVRLAYAHFPDEPKKGKVRPVLILRISDDVIEALKITTNDEVPYPLIDLEGYELGLKKPSWLQLSPTFLVNKVNVGPKLGEAPLKLQAEVVCKID